MTYELAKKLKDAGLNQSGLGCVYDASHEIDYYQHIAYGINVYIPTLSELIEACEPMKADDFGLNVKNGEWETHMIYHGHFDYPEKFKDSDGMSNVDLVALGTTPDEAVANLYISLNKK